MTDPNTATPDATEQAELTPVEGTERILAGAHSSEQLGELTPVEGTEKNLVVPPTRLAIENRHQRCGRSRRRSGEPSRSNAPRWRRWRRQ